MVIEQPPSSQRLGIFGGSFDPPHYGHLMLAEELAQMLALDQVRFVPAGQPPHKSVAAMSATQHRVAMTRLAIAGNTRFALDLFDVERAGLAYTADMLVGMSQRWPAASLWFLMGADSLADLPAWREPARILRHARLAVMARPGIAIDWLDLERRVPGVQARTDLIESVEIGIASRDLRQRVAEGRPIRYQTPPEVEAYIAAHSLYTMRPAR